MRGTIDAMQPAEPRVKPSFSRVVHPGAGPPPLATDPDPTIPHSPTPNPRAAWLFSQRTDLTVFLGSAIASMIALAIGARAGVLYGDAPDWAWVPAVLLIDVAHVWATSFRVYLDPAERKRRPWLYSLVPLVGFAIGVALYSQGELVFWRALAYVAVFHFVRQQYGWVALYRAKAGERGAAGKLIDTLAIYAATLYPLIYWHSHLPRKFWWFLANDFSATPSIIASVAEPIYWLLMAAYVMKSAHGWLMKRDGNPGKDIVVVTTAVCWYVGIVALNSDYAFTVTNVIIHGVPYLALTYWYGRARLKQAGLGVFRVFASGPAAFLVMLWAIAYIEEMFWDRGVWQDRSWLFGSPWVGAGPLARFASDHTLRVGRLCLAPQEQPRLRACAVRVAGLTPSAPSPLKT